jgi:xanthine dioxygenase
VQLIGHGIVYDHEGIAEAKLQHASHKTFHKTHLSPEDEEQGATRFYRWHMDAALYDLEPPKVTTLYGLAVPTGPKQVCRYDDGTGDELEVPLGTTAFVSGKTMFEILPPELKSLAVRSKVKYAPHPFVWMAPARAKSTGLGIETEGLEMPLNELPPWEESKIKISPLVRLIYTEMVEVNLMVLYSSGRTLLPRICTSKCIRVVCMKCLWTLSLPA